MELYDISKGHIWLCYECKKEALTRKKKNQNWEVEVEVEHPPVKDPESINKDIEIVMDLTKHPETKKRKLNENEDNTNKSIDKSSNNSVDEKKKPVKSNQVVEDKDKSKEMDICDFKVMNASKESLASLENSQWVDDDIIKLSSFKAEGN